MSRHSFYKCPPDCDVSYCQFCRGGLAHCEVCMGFEGSLTTECAGERLSGAVLDRVYAGALDFREGAWEQRRVALVIRLPNARGDVPIDAVRPWRSAS